LLLVSLENLESFREAYGFVASDDVQRAVSLMIHNAVRGLGGSSDFVGQISPTEFVLVTSPNTLPALADRIRSRLDQSLDYFYPLKDRSESDFPGKRLTVRMSRLSYDEGPFSDLNALKGELRRRRA
jgi:GGDEF domain-containing protein